MGKKSKYLTVFIILIITISALIIIPAAYLNKMRYAKIPQDDENLGIKNEQVKQGDNVKKEPQVGDNDKKGEIKKENGKKEEEKKDDPVVDEFSGKIINIALLGGDRRHKSDASQADSIIILSIDTVHKKIKLSSIMRDTYVNVYKHGKTKLAHAYAYGGPALTIRTLNENFRLGIRDYIFVDFAGFQRLVNVLGGVEIDVKRYEVGEVNKYIREAAQYTREKPKYIRGPGMQTLNGQQALAYSRIRKVGNGDYARTERQRKVLDIIIKKVQESGPLKLPSIIVSMMPYVETSISKTDIMKLGFYVLNSGINTVEQQRFPLDECSREKIIDKVWYLVTDLEATRRHMRKFIYESPA